MNSIYILLTQLIFTFLLSSCNHVSSLSSLEWDESSEIPIPTGENIQPGLAGALIGVSNDYLIIAGGANFPDGLPWRGAKKIYNNIVYAAKKDKDGKLIWLQSVDTLSKPLAYSANVVYKNGFISVGGENSEGPVSSVHYWTWNNQESKIIKEEYPTLPNTITNASAAILNDQLYIIGGENQNGVFSDVWYLNLNDKEKGWQKGPQLPKATSHSVATVQSGSSGNHLYIIGGRAKQASGISQLYNQILQLDPENKTWIEKSEIGDGDSTITALSAATVITKGDYIFLMGGDDGEIFHQIETYAKQAKEAKSQEERNLFLAKQYQLAEEHAGFSKEVYRYNTVKNEWTKLNQMPYAPVTTTAIIWEDEIFIPTGEIHPGIRTPKILRTKLPNEN